MAFLTGDNHESYIVCADPIINTLSPILYRHTVGTNAEIDVNVLHLEPRPGCLLFLSRETVSRLLESQVESIVIVASSSHTPEGRILLGAFFRDLNDDPETAMYIRKNREIKFSESHHEYQAVGYYDIVDVQWE